MQESKTLYGLRTLLKARPPFRFLTHPNVNMVGFVDSHKVFVQKIKKITIVNAQMRGFSK
jgi:hypothetical protein